MIISLSLIGVAGFGQMSAQLSVEREGLGTLYTESGVCGVLLNLGPYFTDNSVQDKLCCHGQSKVKAQEVKQSCFGQLLDTGSVQIW